MAEEVVNAELKEINFIKWLKACAAARQGTRFYNNGNQTSILGRLASIIDTSNIELSYPLKPKYKYGWGLFQGFRIDAVDFTIEKKGSTTVKTVEYNPINLDNFLVNNVPIYICYDGMSNRKNKYLLTHVATTGFILIRPDVVITAEHPQVLPDDIPELRVDQALANIVKTPEKVRLTRERLADIHNFIYQSADECVNYDEITVPKAFNANNEESEEEQDEQNEEAEQSAAERRKLSGKITLVTPKVNNDNYWKREKKVYTFEQVEILPNEVDRWKNEEVFWSNQEHDKLLHTAALLTRNSDEWVTYGSNYNSNYWFEENSTVRLLRVSQQNTKHFKDFKHITKFFKQLNGKTITMSNALVRWNTARKMKAEFDKISFLLGMENIAPHKYAQCVKVKDYIGKYWRHLDFKYTTLGADETTTGQLITYLDRVTEFQLFVRENLDNTEAISHFAKELFNPAPGVEIADGKALDTEIYDVFKELLEWSEPVSLLMNLVTQQGNHTEYSEQEEYEIRNYFHYRNCPL